MASTKVQLMQQIKYIRFYS